MVTKNKVVTRLRELNAAMPCEACGHRQWFIPTRDETEETDVSEVSILLDPSSGLAATFTPATCTRCGNTRFYSTALLMGTLDADQP